LLGSYLEQREPGENLRRFFARHNNTQLRELLAGEVVAEVVRDLPNNTRTLAQAGGLGD